MQLLPESSSFVPLEILLGDVNQDGVVNFADIPNFILILQASVYVDEADVNQDSVVDFSDIGAFIFELFSQ